MARTLALCHCELTCLSMLFSCLHLSFNSLFAAAKMSLNLFSQMPEATQREKDLMKACTDSELVAAIIGNLKVSATGLNQLKQKEKKGKKASRQQK